MRLVYWIRRLLYRLGMRPAGGSIWFSPSLSWIYALRDGATKESNK